MLKFVPTSESELEYTDECFGDMNSSLQLLLGHNVHVRTVASAENAPYIVAFYPLITHRDAGY